MKPTRAYILLPGAAEWEPITVRSLEHLQSLVGGYIERLPICEDGNYDLFSVCINEEGKLIDLPLTAIWMYEGKPYDGVYGPAVLLGPTDDEGDATDAAPYLLPIVAKHLIPVPKRMGVTITAL